MVHKFVLTAIVKYYDKSSLLFSIFFYLFFVIFYNNNPTTMRRIYYNSLLSSFSSKCLQFWNMTSKNYPFSVFVFVCILSIKPLVFKTSVFQKTLSNILNKQNIFLKDVSLQEFVLVQSFALYFLLKKATKNVNFDSFWFNYIKVTFDVICCQWVQFILNK